MLQWLKQLHTLPAWRVLSQDENHLYLAPHPNLCGYVAHYTITFPAEGAVICPPTTLTIMPDASGCFVFTIGERLTSRFWGATTRAATVESDFSTAPPRFFVEFRPGGAHALTGLNMDTLTDRVFSVEEVLAPLYRDITDILTPDTPLPLLLESMDNLLRQQLSMHGGNRSAAAMLPLLGTPGGLPVPELTVRALAQRAGYSERHLSRLFHTTLGVGVKACARVVRINRLLTHLRPEANLTTLAQEHGYYDQAHFTNDFRRIVGVNPTAYLAVMSDFYNEKYKF